MQLPLSWGDGRSSRGPGLAPLWAVLSSAWQTPGYRRHFHSCGLSMLDTIPSSGTLEDALDRLPPLAAADWQAAPDDYANPGAPRGPAPRLLYPAGLEPRTAVFLPGCAGSRAVRCFAPGEIGLLADFKPESIAAPVRLIERIANLAEAGLLGLPRLSRGLIVYTSVLDPGVDPELRERLWSLFRVPLFEQLLALDGAVIAWECEAYEGLHVATGNVVAEAGQDSELLITSLTDLAHPLVRFAPFLRAEWHDEACGCGRTEPRLAGLASRPIEAVAACA